MHVLTQEREKNQRKKETKNSTIKSLSLLPAQCLISKSPFLRFFFDFVESMSMDIVEERESK